MLDSSNNGLLVDENMQTLISTNTNELQKTINNTTDYENITNVDIRKNLYQYEEQQFYDTIYYYLRICYYGILIIYIFLEILLQKNDTNIINFIYLQYVIYYFHLY